MNERGSVLDLTVRADDGGLSVGTDLVCRDAERVERLADEHLAQHRAERFELAKVGDVPPCVGVGEHHRRRHLAMQPFDRLPHL